MTNTPIQYQWSDAWVLLSVIYASREHPATLVDVIQVGDYINRGIFTESELNSGFFRLTEGGWLTGTDDAWVTTEKTQKEYKRIEQKKLSAYAEMKEIGNILAAPDWTPETNAKNPADTFLFPGLDRSRIAKACQDYSKGFWSA